MSMLGKKKIGQVTTKKQAPGRLIKCYVCNKFFYNQPEFNLHLEQHQSKLNRTSIEQIQRKTQESFRTKRQPSALTRKGSKVEVKPKSPANTTVSNNREKSLQQKEEIKKEQSFQDDDGQTKELQQALRESQIMLEKIDFLTQITEDPRQKLVPTLVEDENQLESSISNEYQLYLQLRNCVSDSQVESLILRTDFHDQTFESYQEQLKLVQNIMKMANNPDSIGKYKKISKSIVQDVIEELRKKYNSQNVQQKRQKEIVKPSNNNGQLNYCSVCYMPIEAGSEFLLSQLDSAYHKECYEE